MRNALIAAVVAAVVAAASGTTATLVVTSKNIKNGTIQTVDISARAKRALKGNRGLRGLTGAPGAQGARGLQGPQGAQGPAGPGLSGLHYVEARATVPPLQVGSAGAECPSGERVISGGGATNVGTLTLTAPFAESSWVVGADNTSPTLTATVVSVALCGRIGTGVAAATTGVPALSPERFVYAQRSSR
jgi:hypothetical protein